MAMKDASMQLWNLMMQLLPKFAEHKNNREQGETFSNNILALHLVMLFSASVFNRYAQKNIMRL